MSERISLPDLLSSNLTIEPIERSETIPSSWYTDPRMNDLERAWVFSGTWQYVGHVSRLAHAGEYLTANVGGNPVIVVRGKDDRLRAFYNVCRHRGGPLAIDEHGTCNALQCKYHGWTYLLDGSLRGVPKFDRVELFDRKDYGLVPIELDVWEGLVFVNLKGGTDTGNGQSNAPAVATMLQGIAQRIGPESLAHKKFTQRVTYDLECNWKVYVDNYLEGYHLPYVHPELCTLLDYGQYVTETSEFFSLQYSPFTDKENLYGAANGQAYYYFVFPNFMMNILPGRLQTNLILSLAHHRTRVVFDYYYDDIESPQAKKMIEDDLSYSEKVQREDMEICELVQRGLSSVAYDKGRFSVEMEQGVYHFQSLLKKTYRKAFDMLTA